MSKKFKLQPIPSIEDGIPIRTPMVEDGRVVVKEGQVTWEEATLLTILESLFRLFPNSKLTMPNINSGVQLKEQLKECRKIGNGYLVLEEAEYGWVKSMLNDGEVGVKIFGFDLLNILKAVDGFEKPKETKE